MQPGDTLQGIAKQAYGDAGYWYRIAEANGLNPATALQTGQHLQLPGLAGTSFDRAESMRPYDASQVIGDTTPTMQPPPPDDGGCGILGMIFVIIVAVVATVLTAGAAAAAMGATATAAGGTGLAALGSAALTGGALVGAGGAVLGAAVGLGAAVVGGIAGSILSQGVGMALGMQDRFSWSNVALGALSAGVTAGLGTVAPGILAGQGTLAVASRAIVANAVTQGIGVATGLQEKFSWASVAASGIGSGVGQLTGYGLQNTAFENVFGRYGVAVASGFAGGAAAAVARGGRISVTQIAADAFGNAIGSSIAEASWGSNQQEQMLGSGIKVNSNIWGSTTSYGEYSHSDLSLTANGVPRLLAQTGDTFDWGAVNDLLPKKDQLQAFELSAGANGQAVPRYTGGYVNGYKAPASASGWQGFVEGVRGEDSVMETPTTAKTLGDYVRTGGQILNSLFNPKEIAQGMWNAIDSGNPLEMGLAALGFLPMGMIGKVGTVEKALLQTEISGVNAIGPVSRLVDGGGLVAHEVAGGHLLERHVGKSADQLLDRLATDPKISGSSSFYNRATAESAIAQSLDANQMQINKWLGGSQRDLKIESALSENIGVTMSKGSTDALDTANLRLILRRDPAMSNGYRIQTGFPTR